MKCSSDIGNYYKILLKEQARLFNENVDYNFLVGHPVVSVRIESKWTLREVTVSEVNGKLFDQQLVRFNNNRLRST